VPPMPPMPAIEERLSARAREQAALFRRELAMVAADADRELLTLKRSAEADPERAEIVERAESALVRLRATEEHKDPMALSQQVDALLDREYSAPDDARALEFRAERLAFGVLTREAHEREQAQLHGLTTQRLTEIRDLPASERQALLDRAAALLTEPAYNDRGAMNRELLLSETPETARIAALARSVPMLGVLEGAAKWQPPAFHDRVAEQTKDRLHAPERDAELDRAIAVARLRAVLSETEEARRTAHDDARELYAVRCQLPVARSLDIDTD